MEKQVCRGERGGAHPAQAPVRRPELRESGYQGATAKKVASPAARCQAAPGLVNKGWSQRRACALMGLVPGSYHPVAHGRSDESVQQALRALRGRHPGWGFWKLHHRLRKNGLVINHKRTLRIYRALALKLPRRLKKRVPARVKQPLAVPEAANVYWSLDFTSDVLTDGRRFRTLNVLDDDNRQLLGVEIARQSGRAGTDTLS